MVAGLVKFNSLGVNQEELAPANHHSPRVFSTNKIDNLRLRTTCFPTFEPLTVDMRDVLSPGVKKKTHLFLLFVPFYAFNKKKKRASESANLRM